MCSRRHFIHPPPSSPAHLNLSGFPRLKGQHGQAVFVDRLLGGRKGGFYVEAGDGRLTEHSTMIIDHV